MICSLCPRMCNAERPNGFCGMPERAVIARAALHYGEEPCISGAEGSARRGSGTIFFKGCNLRCVFCQNHEISRGGIGLTVDAEGLRGIFSDLIAQNALNINLVTPTHYSHIVKAALDGFALPVPVVYNCGGYESVDSLKGLRGLIDVYMPDIKYSDDSLAALYSGCKNYTESCLRAVIEMFRQRGRYRLDSDGIMKSGLLIRHLILPNRVKNTLGVIDMIKETFPRGSVMVSLMGQYTPMTGIENTAPELARPVTEDEYAECAEYLQSAGIRDGYLQPPEASGKEMIPRFN